MKIYKNCLKQEDFLNIKNNLFSVDFPWYWCPQITPPHDNKYFQFIHNFYKNCTISSPFFNLVIPILETIKPISILRIKSNLLIKTKKIEEHDLHTDFEINKKTSNVKTAIFYCNTNNGYTKFKDGTIVKSEENKLIEFNVNKEHTGTSCTDEQRRIVINFNYL